MNKRHPKTKREPTPRKTGSGESLPGDTRSRPDSKSARFWYGAARFYDEWRRDIDSAEWVPRVRLGRGTANLERDIAAAEDTAVDDTGVDDTAVDDTGATLVPAMEVERAPHDELEQILDDLDEVDPDLDDEPALLVLSDATWLGVVAAPPQLGARLVIAEGPSGEFTVTSTVTEIITYDRGVSVQTSTSSRYFISITGDTFLVHHDTPT